MAVEKLPVAADWRIIARELKPLDNEAVPRAMADGFVDCA